MSSRTQLAHFRYILIFCAILCAWKVDAKEPERIVSLAPSCAEIVADLGLQSRLVGVTSFTDYPAEAANLPSVGSYVEPNLEAILALQPDLVVATSDGNPERVLERLRELNVPLIVLDLQSYESIQHSILKLGSITNRISEANELAHRMKSVAGCIRNRTAGVTRPAVLFIYDSYPLITPGKGTFTNELIEMAGASSITQDSSIQYPRLTIETVIARDPDVVIETSMDPQVEREQRLQWWKQYPMVRAVRENHVYVLESKNLDRPSHRIVAGFRNLAATLHPDLFSHGECTGETK